MRQIKLLTTSFVLWIFGTNPLFAQLFDVDTLVYNGSINQCINIVILGDGYTIDQMNNFSVDATTLKDYILGKAPYSNYKNYFNVFTIKTPSVASGAKHPNTASDCSSAYPAVPIANPNTYYGSTFDAYGIHRLLVPMNYSVIASVLANNFPNYDLVFILVNTPYYGGSGGTFATASLNISSNEIAIHEIGHSFAGLADEYWAGAQYAAEKPNMTQDNNSSTIKWKNWLTAGTGISIYPYSGQTWYKPTNGTCDMEVLNKSFCAVCTETIVENIHRLVNPVKGFSPLSSTNTIIDPIYFTLKLMKPVPNTIKTEWSLNGNIINSNADSILLGPSSLIVGSNNISVKVIDTTYLSRSNSHSVSHLYVTNWTVAKTASGIHGISSSKNGLEVKLYPNPSSDFLNINFRTEKQENVNIDIISSQGVILRSLTVPNRLGKENTITIDVSKYAVGSYYVEFKTMNFAHTEKFIKF